MTQKTTSCTFTIDSSGEEVILKVIFNKSDTLQAVDEALEKYDLEVNELNRNKVYTHQTLCYLMSQLALTSGKDVVETLQALGREVSESCIANYEAIQSTGE